MNYQRQPTEQLGVSGPTHESTLSTVVAAFLLLLFISENTPCAGNALIHYARS